jgi:translation initiation factor 1
LNLSNLVWSDDPKDKCVQCGQLKNVCKCKPAQEPIKEYKFVVKFRIEKQGRGGKIVTVMDNLPKQEIFLKELTKEIKSKCGVGGTYRLDGKEGMIEIQGDKIDQIKSLLSKKGIKF